MSGHVVAVDVAPTQPIAVVSVATDGYTIDVPLPTPDPPAAIDVIANWQGGLTDAPNDGGTYGRQYRSWTAVLPLIGGTITGLVTLTANPAAAPPLLTNTALQITGADAGFPRIAIDSFGGNGQITFRKAGGTAATPTALSSGASLGSINYQGHDGTAYSGGSRASFVLATDAAWSLTSNPTRFSWFVTASGATAQTEVMRLASSGNLLLGGTLADAGYKLNVTGIGRFVQSDGVNPALISDTGAGGAFTAAFPTGSSLVVTGPDAGTVRSVVISFGTANSAIDGMNFGGTRAAPSVTAAGRKLLAVRGWGNGTTAAAAAAEINYTTAETWSDTAHGTNILILGTPAGSATVAEWARFINGNLQIGIAGNTGYRLDVNGSARVGTATASTNVRSIISYNGLLPYTAALWFQNSSGGNTNYFGLASGAGAGNAPGMYLGTWDASGNLLTTWAQLNNTSVQFYPQVTCSGNLLIDTGSGNLPAIPQTPGLTISVADNAAPSSVLMGFGTASAPQWIGYRTGGTRAAPSASAVGSALSSLSGGGYGTTGFSAAPRGSVQITTMEVWTDTAQGTGIAFRTTPNTTTTTAEVARFAGSGNLLLASTTDNGVDKLQVTGSARISTGLGVFGHVAPTSQPALTGAKGGNTALASVIAVLVAAGFATDTTTA
jgi:hypothetical protein